MSVTNNVTLSLAWRLGLKTSVSAKNTPYKPARLCTRKGDLSKPWLIEFEVWSEKKEKLIRKQHRVPKKLPTPEARTSWAEKRIKKINEILQAGAINKDDPDDRPMHQPQPTIEQAFEQAFQIIASRLAYQSIRSFRSVKNRFILWLSENGRHNKPVASLSRLDIQNFLDSHQLKKKVSNRTRNSNLSYLMSFTKLFLAKEWIATDPAIGIQRLREKEPEISAYNEKEKAVIIAYIREKDPQLFIYLSVMYYTFRRCTETRLIQLKHINWEQNTLHIPPSNAKGGKSHHVYFSDKLKRQMMLLNWHKMDPEWYAFGNKGTPGPQHYGITPLGSRYRKHLKKLGMYKPFVTIMYAWKHTGITDAHEIAGIKPRTSQDQAGHASLDMHMRYLRRLGVDKASEVENMPDL